ncbi:MAG: pantetheine-phosphate adenylyltransferase [Prevotellaceae bacterium]|jgi:pantetheine-phosphate adenylyltransferase|nr:pantetheine-phosphate adenylyltransferase [Prevotellaceae bacterium]
MAVFFPGSFDPFTAGHYDIVCRALKLFDHVVVGIGTNVLKKSFFTEAERLHIIEQAVGDLRRVSVVVYHGLTVDYCAEHDIHCIIRGVRSLCDYEYETLTAQVNRQLQNGIETVFLPSLPEHTYINSTVVRDILTHGGDASAFLPKKVTLPIKIS